MTRGLGRYFAIATLVVVAVFAYAGFRWMQTKTDIRIASVRASMAPRPDGTGSKTGLGTSGFLADASWALSTLPECLDQTSVTRGDRAFVMAAIPAGARELAPGASLIYADCRIAVETDGVVVHRGPDTLRVPAPVRLFRSGAHLYVLVRRGAGAQLRAYVPSKL